MKKSGLIILIILISLIMVGIVATSLAFGNTNVDFFIDGKKFLSESSINGEVQLPLMKIKEETHFVGWFYDRNYTKKIDEPVIKIIKLKSGNIFGKFEECSFSNYILEETPICGKDGILYRECFVCKNKLTETVSMNENHSFNGNRCTVCHITKESEGFEWREIDGGIELTGKGDCNDVDVIIPSIYQGKRVISIGKSLFADAMFLETIQIPNTIKYINEKAFYYCKNLYQVKIEDNSQIVEIDDFAFDHCISLKFFDYNLKNLEIIGNNAFSYTKIPKFVFGENLVSVGIEAFRGISALENIIFSESNKIKTLELGVFRDCDALKEIILPDNVEKIDKFAFFQCFALQTFRIRSLSKLNFIGESAFYSCRSLEKIRIPKEVEIISSFAFADCYNLIDVAFSKDSILTTICEGAFKKSSFKSITFPNKLKVIEDMAFFEGRLTSLTIPSSLQKIGDYAFFKNQILESINFEEGEESSLTSIGKKAFSDCYYLMKFIMPNSLSFIGENAFSNCEWLYIFDVNKDIAYIGKGAFENCIRIKIYLFAVNENGWHEDWNIDSAELIFKKHE